MLSIAFAVASLYACCASVVVPKALVTLSQLAIKVPINTTKAPIPVAIKAPLINLNDFVAVSVESPKALFAIVVAFVSARFAFSAVFLATRTIVLSFSKFFLNVSTPIKTD